MAGVALVNYDAPLETSLSMVFQNGRRRGCLFLRYAAFNKTTLLGSQIRIEKSSVPGQVLSVSILLRCLSEKCHRSPSC
jgi:hypothetical protein